MSRRTFSILGAAGFLAVTVSAVYLLIAPSSLRHQIMPKASEGGQVPACRHVRAAHQDRSTRGGAGLELFGPPVQRRDSKLDGPQREGSRDELFRLVVHTCRLEAHELEVTYRKYQTRGIAFLGVDIQQDDWDDARDFLEKLGITYPAVRDVNGEIAQKFELVGLPTTYFVDEHGMVRSKFIGAFLGPDGAKELVRRIEIILPQ